MLLGYLFYQISVVRKEQADSLFGGVPYDDSFHCVLYRSDRRKRDPQRAATVSNRNDTVLNEETVLFSSLIGHIYLLQSNVSTSFQAIVYSVNPESGLGNVIIGLVSCIIAAVATDRAIQSTPVQSAFLS